MDWDAHLQPPEPYSLTFSFSTWFDGVECGYDWDEGYLHGENGEVNFNTHPHGAELKAFVDQTIWLYSLPEDPKEIVIDDKYIVAFVTRVHKGTAVWQFLHVRDMPKDYDDWGDIITPTADIVKKAHELLGNPFISFYPHWRKFDDFEGE